MRGSHVWVGSPLQPLVLKDAACCTRRKTGSPRANVSAPRFFSGRFFFSGAACAHAPLARATASVQRWKWISLGCVGVIGLKYFTVMVLGDHPHTEKRDDYEYDGRGVAAVVRGISPAFTAGFVFRGACRCGRSLAWQYMHIRHKAFPFKDGGASSAAMPRGVCWFADSLWLRHGTVRHPAQAHGQRALIVIQVNHFFWISMKRSSTIDVRKETIVSPRGDRVRGRLCCPRALF